MKWNFDLIAPEIDNVRAVLEWALGHDPERGLRLAAWLEAYWVVRDPTEGAWWLERLLELCPDADPALRANSLRALAGARDILGEPEQAAPCYRESLELFTSIGAEQDAAHLRFRVAANMTFRGETTAAWPLIEDHLDESRRLRIPVFECQALGFLGWRAREAGDLAAAVDLAVQSAGDRAGRRLDMVGGGPARRTPRRSSASAETSRPPNVMRCAPWSSLSSSETAAPPCFTRPSSPRSPARGGITPGRAGSGEPHENEALAGRLAGQWDWYRAETEARVVRPDDPVFTAAQDEGALLSIAEAAGLEAAQTEP